MNFKCCLPSSPQIGANKTSSKSYTLIERIRDKRKNEDERKKEKKKNVIRQAKECKRYLLQSEGLKILNKYSGQMDMLKSNFGFVNFPLQIAISHRVTTYF